MKHTVEIEREQYNELLRNSNEAEHRIAEASEKAYQMALSDCQKKMQDKEAELKELQHQNLLLQVRHDQLLKTTKELTQCLQYETGNGFIK